MTKKTASQAAAALVDQLKKANAEVKDGSRVSATKYVQLQRKLTRRIGSI